MATVPDLLTRLKDGHDSAFEELVREHSPRMLAVIRRYLPQEHDALDALQDAFTSVFRSLALFKGESSLATWLHRIAVNAALMRLRTKKRRHESLIEDLLPRYLLDGHREQVRANWAITVDCGIDQLETREIVRQCMEHLPESYRAILMLRDIEERSTEETAELLELSIPNVKTRLHRARQALRELLDAQFGDVPIGQ